MTSEAMAGDASATPRHRKAELFARKNMALPERNSQAQHFRGLGSFCEAGLRNGSRGLGVLKTDDPPFMAKAGRAAGPTFEILKPGDNCRSVGLADRASVLVDAANYFTHLDAALRKAQRSIVIIGWDFDAGIRLRQEDAASLELGDLLRKLVEECS